jgi:septal ring factor EnvC (AmiA/AmiB activator)
VATPPSREVPGEPAQGPAIEEPASDLKKVETEVRTTRASLRGTVSLLKSALTEDRKLTREEIGKIIAEIEEVERHIQDWERRLAAFEGDH